MKVRIIFDFLMSEVWWLETVIASAISGICGIVIALIGLMPKLNKILSRLEQQDTTIQNEHGGLSKEHDRLAGQHVQLEKAIMNGTQTIVSGAKAISGDLRYLRDEQIKVSERQQALTTQHLDIQRTTEHIVALNSELGRLQAVNQALIRENEVLRQDHDKLEKINTRLLDEIKHIHDRGQDRCREMEL